MAKDREAQGDEQSFIEDEGSVENQENISQEHVQIPMLNASHADSFKK